MTPVLTFLHWGRRLDLIYLMQSVSIFSFYEYELQCGQSGLWDFCFVLLPTESFPFKLKPALLSKAFCQGTH